MIKTIFALAYPFSWCVFLAWFSFLQWSPILLVWADVETPGGSKGGDDATV